MAETAKPIGIVVPATSSRGVVQAASRATLPWRLVLALIAAVALHTFAPDAIGQSAVVQIDSRNNGSKTSLPKGGRLVVTLQARPGTGYAWEVVGGPSRHLQLQSSVFQPASGLPGGSENQVLTFLAREAGEAALVLSYRRPGDATSAQQEFRLSVTVARQ